MDLLQKSNNLSNNLTHTHLTVRLTTPYTTPLGGSKGVSCNLLDVRQGQKEENKEELK